MKNFLLLFAIAITLFSCGKDKPEETPQPVSKDGLLEIQYTSTVDGYSEITLVNKTSHETNREYTTSTGTSINYNTSVALRGGQTFRINIRTIPTSGANYFSGNYTIKVIYNGTVLLNESYYNNSGLYGKDIILPFIN